MTSGHVQSKTKFLPVLGPYKPSSVITAVKDFFVIDRRLGSYGSNRTKTNQTGYNNQIPS